MGSQPSISLEAPAHAARIAQRIPDYIHEHARAIDDRLAVVRVSGYNPAREVCMRIERQSEVIVRLVFFTENLRLEISVCQRAAIVKNTDAAPHNRAVVLKG